MQMIFKVSVHNARLEIPKNPAICPAPVSKLINSCWESFPEKRPSAEAIKYEIENILLDLTK